MGSLRCREKVTPLVAACFNKNIPLSIIELLLKNGADPNQTIELNGIPISILEDIEKYYNVENPSEKDRLEKIKKLLIQYGANVGIEDNY